MEKDINSVENNKYNKNKPYGQEELPPQKAKQEVYTDFEPKKGLGNKEELLVGKTTIERYIKDSSRTFAYRTKPLDEKTTDQLHCAIGASTEAGELLDAFKKHIYYGKPLDVVNVGEEIADICWYLANLSRLLELDFEKLLHNNIEKLKVRFPDKFDAEKAENRNLTEERKELEK